MKKALILSLTLALASCANIMTLHRMKAADRKLADTHALQSQGRWDDAIAMAEKMHSSVAKSVEDKPVWKSKAGADVDLRPLLTALEAGPLKQLNTALKAHNTQQSQTAFVALQQQCTNCHLALGKNDIRLAPLSGS